MLGAAIIVFREVLEAALIVGIVLAASIGAPRRGLWISTGLAGGLVGAGLVAVFAAEIASAAAGIGQELLNAVILLLAVGMLGWHNIWMSRHGRELAATAREVGDAVISGARPLYVLAVVVGLAVLREGSETVLFLYGIAAGGGLSANSLLAGGILGLAGGVAVGAALYLGLLRIPTRRLFTVTSWMVLLLAAGMASQAAGYLVQADLLPPLGDAVWDTSAVLTEDSILGKALHTLIGYVSRPDGIQILFYLATLCAIRLLTRMVGSPVNPRPAASLSRGAATPLLVILLLGGLGAGSAADAQLRVRYPIVDYREVEIEHFSDITFDKPKSGLSNNQRYTNEYGFGPLPNWFVEFGNEFRALNGENITYDATEAESYLQLTPTGKYFGDLAMFAEYEQTAHRADAKSFIFGPLAQTEFGEIAGFGALHTLNLLFTRTVGNNSTEATQLNTAWQSRLLVNPLIEPGFEYYGQINEILNPGKPAVQQHRIGPVFVGLALQIDPGSVGARVGIASTLVSNLLEGWSNFVQEDQTRAEKLLLEVFERDANNPVAHWAMGMLRRVQNRLAEARIEFETATALDRNSRSFAQLGFVLMYLGQPEAAIPNIQKAIRLSPDDPNIYASYGGLGICELFLGHIDEAIDLLRKARAANPRIYSAHLFLAGALGLKGDLDDARLALSEAIKLKPDVTSLARWHAYRPWETNPQYWALREKTLNVGLRRAGFPDE